MYQKKFAVALKSARGRVLREFDGDKVYVPFGSEYSVFLKNMHNRRAVAQISIDGVDVGDGMTFVVPAYGQLEVERFVKNGNLHEGNRFKFIEQTAAVANHRGVDVEDGLVRVTFQLEKERPRIQPYYGGYYNDLLGGVDHTYRSRSGGYRSRSGGLKGASVGDNTRSFTANASTHDSFSVNHVSDASFDASASLDASLETASDAEVYTSAGVANEVGVTAPGSVSGQEFTLSDNFPLEAEKIVFVLQILGETADNRHVREPVTVKTRPRCSQCGTFNHHTAKFCKECGAGLQIV